jgi:hypothetical protein
MKNWTNLSKNLICLCHLCGLLLDLVLLCGTVYSMDVSSLLSLAELLELPSGTGRGGWVIRLLLILPLFTLLATHDKLELLE